MNENSLKLFKTKPLRLVEETHQEPTKSQQRTTEQVRSELMRQLDDAARLASYPGGLKKRNKYPITP